MKWLVCGGRNYGTDGPNGPEYRHIIDTLEGLAQQYCPGYPSEEVMLPEGIEVISGKAKGVDTVAIDWAIVNWLTFQEFPAEWNKYGKSAGMKRNMQMLHEGKPDLVIAFPGGKGTAMMIRIARDAGLPVLEIPSYNTIPYPV